MDRSISILNSCSCLWFFHASYSLLFMIWGTQQWMYIAQILPWYCSFLDLEILLMCWTLGCWAWIPGGCGGWTVLTVYVKLISISLLVFCLPYGLPVLLSSVMKLWVYDVFSESESCNCVFVTVWYHFFFHLFFNAVLQNIELCLDSFNAMTATGFNNNLSNLFCT